LTAGHANAGSANSGYAGAGVDTRSEEAGLSRLLDSLRATMSLRPGVGRPLLDFGLYANVLDLGNGTGLAISTDGVGTKILVAEMLGKYDTIGIDCVGMNVNDVICVGAEPISMVDYIAVERLDARVLAEIGKGLLEGARQARITIPAGEIAQVREMVKGVREGAGFDLVGTCVGLVPTDRILVGDAVAPGDAVIGLRSSGIHSNGYTLARRALLSKGSLQLERHVPELGRTLGEELLEPTKIYVREAMALIQSDIPVRAFVHVTSDGFLNLARVTAPVGFDLVSLPEPQPIFDLIRAAGAVPIEEMYRVYNMGIGFCAIVPAAEADRAVAILSSFGTEAMALGTVVADPERKVMLPGVGLVGIDERFERI
jgi:phosphoribosylformylglycinamidine cyclo-ligase